MLANDMVSPHYIGDSQEVSTLDDCNDDEFPSKIVTLFKSSQEKIDSAPLKLNPSPPSLMATPLMVIDTMITQVTIITVEKGYRIPFPTPSSIKRKGINPRPLPRRYFL